eukprot:CAMPEP_0184706594 /NCGR_PEP_ID=MMETSP0313-20130426/36839_1 /TAXON_ID=2792 /ORGANISM="Porphyridium aerugineum, Strain SAG 1380-2" /LENGTH=102 /DNA_ID=CAMNT_0027168153 /DNA_START=201 /DNA_END=509 /DNA_ORIENTATION=-
MRRSIKCFDLSILENDTASKRDRGDNAQLSHTPSLNSLPSISTIFDQGEFLEFVPCVQPLQPTVQLHLQKQHKPQERFMSQTSTSDDASACASVARKKARMA